MKTLKRLTTDNLVPCLIRASSAMLGLGACEEPHDEALLEAAPDLCANPEGGAEHSPGKSFDERAELNGLCPPSQKSIDDVQPRALSVTPTDPLFGAQKWHYDAVRVPEAWSLTKGSSNVLVAVADSGKRGHLDLNTKWSGGYDFWAGDADPTAPAGDWHHGIHVAGIIGASTSTTGGVGGAGICWNCPLMPIRTLSYDGWPVQSDPTKILASSIRYAAGLPADNGKGQIVQAVKRADVLNISLGNFAGPCPVHLKTALSAAASAGTVVVVAAGNGSDGGDYDPANYLWTTCNDANLVVVTAVDAFGNAEEYALKGSGVTIAAPGGRDENGDVSYGKIVGCANPDPLENNPPPTSTGGLLSSWITSNDQPCYRHLSGTSMAAPHVTGVVALMRSRNPTLTVAQVKSILEKTAKKSIPCGTACGAGLVDAYKAVDGAIFNLGLACEAMGNGNFYCDPLIAGGVGLFTASWQAVSNAGIPGAQANMPQTIIGTCTVGMTAKVKATFTDAIGRVVTQQRSFVCHKIPL